MTGKLSKNFHGVGIGPLSKILAVKRTLWSLEYYIFSAWPICDLTRFLNLEVAKWTEAETHLDTPKAVGEIPGTQFRNFGFNPFQEIGCESLVIFNHFVTFHRNAYHLGNTFAWNAKTNKVLMNLVKFQPILYKIRSIWPILDKFWTNLYNFKKASNYLAQFLASFCWSNDNRWQHK